MTVQAKWKLQGFDTEFSHIFESFKEANEFREILRPALIRDSFIIWSENYRHCWGTQTIDFPFMKLSS